MLTSFQLFVISLGIQLVKWGFGILRDHLGISSIVTTAPFWWAMLAISASNLGGAVPSMAASLGTFEGAASGAMVLAGAQPEVGLGYAMVIHAIHLVVSSSFGAIGLAIEGQSLTKLVADLRLDGRYIMRVLIGLTYYRPHYSGLTIYTERLARTLVARVTR